MSSTCALIDIGGSSVKVTISEAMSGEIFEGSLPLHPIVKEKRVFLDIDVLFKRVLEVMNMAVQHLPAHIQIEEVFISTIRQGFCLIQDGVEVTPLILNSDTTGYFARTSIEEYGAERIYRETGHWYSPQLTLPKLIHLKQIEPSLFSENTFVLFAHDWLVWKLSQHVVTEMTLVSGGQLALLSEKRVHYELLDYFQLSRELIPASLKFGDFVGGIQPTVLLKLSKHWEVSQIRVGGGDSHFLHAGASGQERGRVVVSAGSSTPISILSSELEMVGTLQPWKSTSFSSENYLLEGNLGYPGMFHDWLRKQGDIEVPKLDTASVYGAPTVFGSCNVWNESKWENRPAFSLLGNGGAHPISEIAFGLTLDYAFALVNQLSLLIQEGIDVKDVVITGGGANSTLVQIVQAMLDIPVTLMKSSISISNLFKLLESPTGAELAKGSSYPELDSSVKEALLNRSNRHSELYLQIEGTRQVIENVS